MTIFAKPLPPGGTIGVAAPASPYDARSEILRGVEWWESRGYRVKLADGVFDRDDYVAGDARSRAADLAALFDDPEVDVVQCLQGGYGSAQTIPHLDFDQIAANPKPFVGYSDITALHVAIRQRAQLATLYGYGLVGVGDAETTDFSRSRLLEVLGGVDGEMKACDWGDQREASDWARSRSLEDVLEQHLEPLGIPVLYKLPLGHGKHMASLPLGVRYTLDADSRTLTLDEPPFR